MKDTLNISSGDSLVLEQLEYSSITIKVEKDNQPPFVSNDTFFTVVTTLSIFALGIIINRLLQYFENRQYKLKQREHFIFYFEKIRDKLLPKLVNGYKSFYQNTNINTGFPSTPPKILTGDFKRS